MLTLQILRPECFSKAQTTCLEIFQESATFDSLIQKLDSMRFIHTCFDYGKDENQVWLKPNYETNPTIAAIYEVE